MIVLYSGTPGSEKSLDTVSATCKWYCRRASAIRNFPVDVDSIRTLHKDIRYVPNWELDPDKLVEFSREYSKEKKCKEDSILLVTDEAQFLFSSRD